MDIGINFGQSAAQTPVWTKGYSHSSLPSIKGIPTTEEGDPVKGQSSTKVSISFDAHKSQQLDTDTSHKLANKTGQGKSSWDILLATLAEAVATGPVPNEKSPDIEIKIGSKAAETPKWTRVYFPFSSPASSIKGTPSL